MKTRIVIRAASAALVCLSLVLTTVVCSAEVNLGALRAKAESGNAIAQYNLGWICFEGRLVSKDPIEAYVWLSLAAENGATGRTLKVITEELSAEQLVTAQERLTERRSVITTHLLAQSAITPGSSFSAAEAAPAARTIRTGSGTLPVTPPPSPTPEPTATPAAADVTGVDQTAALQKEAVTLRADNAKLSVEITSAWKELDAAKTAKAAAGQRADQAEAAANQRATEISTLQAERDQLRQQLAAAAAAKPTPPAREHDEPVNALAAAQAKALVAAQAGQTKTAAELERARQQLTAAETAKADLAAQVKKLAGEDESLKVQLAAGRDAARRLEEAQATIARLQGETADLKAKIAAIPAGQAKALAAAPAEALVAAQAGQSKTAAELERARQQLTAAETANADLAAQVKKLAGENEPLKGQLAAGRDAARRLEEAQATIARLQGETADLKAKIAAIPVGQAKALAAAPAPLALASAAEGLADEMVRLKQDLARARTTVEMTVRSYALVRQENERLRAQLVKSSPALVAAPAGSP